jgi:hypothetical protein
MPDRLAVLNELIAELEAEQKRPGGDTIAAWRHLMDLRRERADLEARISRRKSPQQRLVEAAEQTARNTTPRLDRSRMSVKAKSEYIARSGQAAYLRLPMGPR